MPDAEPDPRPLLGEPLPLDLLNTTWIERGQLQDLLVTVAGVRTWLRSARISPDSTVPPASEEVRRALCQARQVIQAVAEQPSAPQALDAFNRLLKHGRRERMLTAAAPAALVVVDSPEWTVPWLAAEEYVDLLLTCPDRVKRCVHPECVLWYLDTSRSGTRRWCSMSGCGNRAKATRHYRRQTAPDG
jgi:predicted RNA-binding Zn ribbon-like protein